jgi:hypothetical protein
VGAIWPSLNQTLVWALVSVDREKAWDEWNRNALAADSTGKSGDCRNRIKSAEPSIALDPELRFGPAVSQLFWSDR